MKIYNKIVIKMATGEILEEDSFEYKGQIAHCGGGGTTVKAPQPTAQERALQQAQLEILQLQRKESEMMRPYVLKGMGLIEEDGALRYMTEDERMAGMSELEKGQYELTELSQERQAQAYAGELPISPALETSLTEQQSAMAQALSQRLGSNWMATTPGQQAMSEFQKRADLVREEARRGAITTEGGLLLSNLGYLGNVQGMQAQMAGQYPTRTSGLFGGFGAAQEPYQQQRSALLSASIYNAQAKAQEKAAMWGGIGSLAGSGAGAYGTYAGLAAASSKILKENIKNMTSPIEKLNAIRGVDFDWKEGTGHDVGVIAEEIEKVIPEAVVEIKGIKHVFYYKLIPLLIEAVKAQQAQINKMEVSHA